MTAIRHRQSVQASWPGLSRPSTWFGASTDREHGKGGKLYVDGQMLPARASPDSTLNLRSVDGRGKPGHDGRGLAAQPEAGSTTAANSDATTTRLDVR